MLSNQAKHLGLLDLSLIGKNFSKLDLVKKELKDLHNDFGKLNQQVDDSTLLGI